MVNKSQTKKKEWSGRINSARGCQQINKTNKNGTSKWENYWNYLLNENRSEFSTGI